MTGIKTGPAFLLLVVCATCFTDCHPTARTSTNILYPEGAAVDPGAIRFDVEVNGTERTPKDANNVTVSDSKVAAELHFHGRRASVLIHVWSDKNGNGKRDSGDLEGSLASPVLARDHGFCSGTLTATPDIVLTPIP